MYHHRIYEFINDVKNVKTINDHIVNKYTVKKMNGTKGIFKFYVNRQDGSRCLIRYDEKDDLIFDKEPGIIILRVTTHERQGVVARRLDKILSQYDQFLYEDDDTFVSDEGLDYILSEEYMKSVYIPDNFNVDQIAEIISDDDSKTVYPPSIKQKKALLSKWPTLLLGCAGSGKTLIEVCKTLKHAHEHVEQAYFTYTNGLKEMSESVYKKYKDIPGIVGKTHFYSIRDYMISTLEYPLSNYMNYERFKVYLKKEKIYLRFRTLEKIAKVDLWIEIRGLIKGYLGESYYRNLELRTFKQIENKSLSDTLIKENIIKHDKHKKNFFIIDQEELFKYAEKDHQLRQLLIENDFFKPIIDRYTYIDVNDRYSRFSKEERTVILDFVEKHYQPYLDLNKLYDDNDLARNLIIKAIRNEVKKFDYVYIDEVQDLSEMQMYSLMHLSNQRGNIYMAGDISQIINPTFFKGGRPGVILRNRFKIDWNKNNVIRLDENYRNSKDIVEVANKLVALRKEKLGHFSEYIEEDSKKREKSDGLPALLSVDQKNLFDAIKLWIDVPKVAIVVSSDSSKLDLAKSLGIDLRKSGSNIYSVQEVKGQEFDKVIIYNVVSDYEAMWKTIMNTNIKDRQEHYQFYFNLFYVAITRAKKNLYLYEENQSIEVLKELSPFFEQVNNNIIELLDITEYQSETEMLEQARKHFANEEYDRARIFYHRLERKRDVIICRGYELIQRGEITAGVNLLYRFRDQYTRIYQYTSTEDTMLFHLLIGYRLKELMIEEIEDRLKETSILDLAKTYKKDINYLNILSDAIDLMSKLKQYQVKKELNKIHG